MRQLNIALALLTQGEEYLLQRRGDNPRIGGAGLIGCFGGKIEADETPQAAAQREVSEEVGIDVPKDKFVHLGNVHVESDHQLESVAVTAEVFRVDIAQTIDIKPKEGELVRLTKATVSDVLSDMTTGTRAVFELLILPSNNG